MIHRRVYFIYFAIGLGSFVILLRSVYISNNNYESPSNNTNNSDIKNLIYKTLNIKPKRFDDHDIELILEKTRVEKIRRDMSNYNFSDSGVNRLEDLLMESGGTPLRSIIVSTWRSGTTFFGDLLNSVPGNYYNFEPLTPYGMEQISKPSETVKALKHLKNIMKCNVIDMPGYFDFYAGKVDTLLKQVMGIFWKHCIGNEQLCFDPDFTSRVCKLFPIQSMKVTRLRLKLFEELLKDEEFNLKIVFLVRDPRGVMFSRRKESFCHTLHWTEPEILCAHMTRDYVAANRFIEKYPDRIMVVRFEDLIFDMFNNTREILEFLNMSMTPSVGEFLRTHTKSNQPGLLSTYKNSRDVPLKWKFGLDFDYVDDLQLVCKKAMDLWGYELAHNASHMTSKDFYPLKPYTITHQYLGRINSSKTSTHYSSSM